MHVLGEKLGGVLCGKTPGKVSRLNDVFEGHIPFRNSTAGCDMNTHRYMGPAPRSLQAEKPSDVGRALRERDISYIYVHTSNWFILL